jgi:hypothetical protein
MYNICAAIRHIHVKRRASLREAWFFYRITPQSGIDHDLVSVVKILLKFRIYVYVCCHSIHYNRMPLYLAVYFL